MGLDMYVYRLRRLSDAEMEDLHGLNMDELEKRYMVFYGDSVDEYPSGIQHILPFLRKIEHVRTKTFNMERCMEHYGIPKDWIRTGAAYGNSVQFSFRKRFEEIREEDNLDYDPSIPDSPEKLKVKRVKYSDEVKEIDMTSEEYDQFLEDIETSVYVCDGEDILYWRKEYDLQDMIYSLYEGQIENCGYHALNDDMKDAICAFREGQSIPDDFFVPDDDVIYAYHEWY